MSVQCRSESSVRILSLFFGCKITIINTCATIPKNWINARPVRGYVWREAKDIDRKRLSALVLDVSEFSQNSFLPNKPGKEDEINP